MQRPAPRDAAAWAKQALASLPRTEADPRPQMTPAPKPPTLLERAERATQHFENFGFGAVASFPKGAVALGAELAKGGNAARTLVEANVVAAPAGGLPGSIAMSAAASVVGGAAKLPLPDGVKSGLNAVAGQIHKASRAEEASRALEAGNRRQAGIEAWRDNTNKAIDGYFQGQGAEVGGSYHAGTTAIQLYETAVGLGGSKAPTGAKVPLDPKTATIDIKAVRVPDADLVPQSAIVPRPAMLAAGRMPTSSLPEGRPPVLAQAHGKPDILGMLDELKAVLAATHGRVPAFPRSIPPILAMRRPPGTNPPPGPSAAPPPPEGPQLEPKAKDLLDAVARGKPPEVAGSMLKLNSRDRAEHTQSILQAYDATGLGDALRGALARGHLPGADPAIVVETARRLDVRDRSGLTFPQQDVLLKIVRGDWISRYKRSALREALDAPDDRGVIQTAIARRLLPPDLIPEAERTLRLSAFDTPERRVLQMLAAGETTFGRSVDREALSRLRTRFDLNHLPVELLLARAHEEGLVPDGPVVAGARLKSAAYVRYGLSPRDHDRLVHYAAVPDGSLASLVAAYPQARDDATGEGKLGLFYNLVHRVGTTIGIPSTQKPIERLGASIAQLEQAGLLPVPAPADAWWRGAAPGRFTDDEADMLERMSQGAFGLNPADRPDDAWRAYEIGRKLGAAPGASPDAILRLAYKQNLVGLTPAVRRAVLTGRATERFPISERDFQVAMHYAERRSGGLQQLVDSYPFRTADWLVAEEVDKRNSLNLFVWRLGTAVGVPASNSTPRRLALALQRLDAEGLLPARDGPRWWQDVQEPSPPKPIPRAPDAVVGLRHLGLEDGFRADATRLGLLDARGEPLDPPGLLRFRNAWFDHSMTVTEYRILCSLKDVPTREALRQAFADLSDGTMKNMLSNLRKKLGVRSQYSHEANRQAILEAAQRYGLLP